MAVVTKEVADRATSKGHAWEELRCSLRKSPCVSVVSIKANRGEMAL
jgi:hypothetical protein